MASDSKATCNPVTKEIECRIKQTPEHLFEVFLEIREPTEKEAPEILIKYPADFSDDILKTATHFAYPCKIPPDEQSEHFAFVVLDATGTLFRFGYCRRSNREATCLCIISFYPWFETFYTILNDLAQIINSKALNDSPQPSVLVGVLKLLLIELTEDMEQFLSSLYHYKLMSNGERKEVIEINSLFKNHIYNRPDTTKLPSIFSNRNFAVMFSRLGPEIMLCLFAHLLFERRILFVSSKLFHLTACVYGCLHLIYPMHWQSIFLPILPSTMTWTTQCTSPYIIGIHSSVFSTLNMDELGDVVIVNIDEKKLETQYDDLNCFPKYLTRSMKKGIQQSAQLAGDHLARVFLRAMAFTIGNYASGFVNKDTKLDFDRERYLEQYLGSHLHTFMSAVAQTQMFEQFSRYRTHAQLQRETDIDEFDLEVKNFQQLQQSKKFKTNKKIYKLFERAANPLFEQVQTKAGKLQTAINKAGQRVASEASSLNEVIKRTQNSKINDSTAANRLSVTIPLHQSNSSGQLNEKSIPYARFNSNGKLPPFETQLVNEERLDSSSSDSSRSSSPELKQQKTQPLINLDFEDNPLLPSPIVLNVINTPFASPTPRSTPQVVSKIKQLQSELQHKVQTFDGKRLNPRDELGQQTEIKKLVKQFDPLDDTNKTEKDSEDFFSSIPVTLRSKEKSFLKTSERHPSLFETIPTNRVTDVLQNIHTNYGTTNRLATAQPNNLIHFSPMELLPKRYPTIPDDPSVNFDPLAPSNEKVFFPDIPSTTSKINGSNLIDF